ISRGLKPSTHEVRNRIVSDAVVTQCRHEIRRLRAPRTIRIADTALMAQPYRRIRQRPFPQTPLHPNHLLAREGIVSGGDWTNRRKGAALIAGRKIVSVKPHDLTLELKVRLYQRACHS